MTNTSKYLETTGIFEEGSYLKKLFKGYLKKTGGRAFKIAIYRQ